MEMKNEQVINNTPSPADVKKVMSLIRQHGVGALDTKKAEELGLFSRISFLVCAMHCLYTTAFRLQGEVDNLFDAAGARRHAIKMELENLAKAYDRFFRFFREFQTMDGVREMNEESEEFYHQFMRWCKLPELWALGDPQEVPTETDPMVRVSLPDKDLNFYTTVIDTESIEEPEESYCVTKYDRKARSQETVEDNVDKAYAQMVAKRMSANDPDAVYTATKVVEKTERRTIAIPLKVFIGGEMAGSYREIIKSALSD